LEFQPEKFKRNEQALSLEKKAFYKKKYPYHVNGGFAQFVGTVLGTDFFDFGLLLRNDFLEPIFQFLISMKSFPLAFPNIPFENKRFFLVEIIYFGLGSSSAVESHILSTGLSRYL
jgi:hypothetical protein